MAMILGLPLDAGAQSTESVGTRAQGMGGAFVGVADDASAVYWNPAGLAGGAYFSLVLDGNTARSVPDAEPEGANRSGWLLALSMPALGLSYTRLQTHDRSARLRHSGKLAPRVPADASDWRDAGALHRRQSCRRRDRESWSGAPPPPQTSLGNDREDLLDHVDLLGHSSTRGRPRRGGDGRCLVRPARPDGSEPHRSWIRHRPRRGVAARDARPGRADRCCSCRSGSWRETST